MIQRLGRKAKLLMQVRRAQGRSDRSGERDERHDGDEGLGSSCARGNGAGAGCGECNRLCGRCQSECGSALEMGGEAAAGGGIYNGDARGEEGEDGGRCGGRVDGGGGGDLAGVVVAETGTLPRGPCCCRVADADVADSFGTTPFGSGPVAKNASPPLTSAAPPPVSFPDSSAQMVGFRFGAHTARGLFNETAPQDVLFFKKKNQPQNVL